MEYNKYRKERLSLLHPTTQKGKMIVMAMNVNEIRFNARQEVIKMLMPEFVDNGAIKFGDGLFAIPVTVDGVDVWVEVGVKVKAWTPTKTRAAFDPHEKAAEWEAAKKIKKA